MRYIGVDLRVDDAAFLLIHGSNDRTVPIEDSRDFHAALIKAGHQNNVNLKLEEVSGAGHGLGNKFNDFIPMSIAFLKRHLGGTP